MATEAVKPMLGDLTLPLVQAIHTGEANTLIKHAIPGLNGALFQDMGRQSTLVTLVGVAAGDTAKQDVERLRALFHAAEPLTFVADIMTATEVQQVLLADLEVRELAGKPDNFWYRVALKEYIPPPPEETIEGEVEDEAQEEQDDLQEQVDENAGTIVVEVAFEAGSADYSGFFVQVTGTTAEGESVTFTIEEQTDGVFRRDNVPAGDYTTTLMKR